MKLLDAQRASVYLAVGSAFAAVISSGEVPPALALAIGAAYAASFVVGERTAGRGVAAWNVGLIGALGYLALNVVTGQSDLVLAASIFLMLVALHRLYNRRSVGDYAFLHLASLLMLAAGAALSSQVVYGACFLTFAVSMGWSVTLTLLRQEIESEGVRTGAREHAAAILDDDRFVSSRLLAGLGGVAVAALVMASAVFAIFPRVSFGMIRRASLAAQRTGFTGRVELGGAGRIKDDPQVALRIRPVGGEPRTESLERYWRGTTLDRYDGRSWSDSFRGRQAVELNGAGLWALGESHASGAADEALEVSFAHRSSSGVLFTTGKPVSARWVQPEGLAPVQELPTLQRGAQGDLTFWRAKEGEVRYLLRTTPTPAAEPIRGLGTEYPPWVREHFLALPPLDPRVEALADELTKGLEPAAAAFAVEARLKSMRYTMELGGVHGDDPLATFLFDAKAGHCEYFATAMAVLLRKAGVPTRVVTGYYGGRLVESGGYYAVREGDAHAWVEVYFPTRGWVTFDPTPPHAREAQLGGAYASFQLWLDGVRTAWQTTVVSYDLDAQLKAVDGAVKLFSEATERFSAGASSPGEVPWRAILRALGALVVLASPLGWWLWRRSRRRATAEVLTRARANAARLHGALVKRLARRGLVVRPSWTPREIAAETRKLGLESSDRVSALFERYGATRFGARPFEDAELAALLVEVARL